MEVEVLKIGKEIYDRLLNSNNKLCDILKEMNIEPENGRKAMYCHLVFNEFKVMETLKNIDRLDIFDNYKPYLILSYVKYIKKNTDNLKNITETFIRNFNYIFLNSYMLNEKELRLFIKMLTDVEVPEKRSLENLTITTEPVLAKLDTTEYYSEILDLLKEIKSDNVEKENRIQELLKNNSEDLKKTVKEEVNKNTRILSDIEIEIEKQENNNIEHTESILKMLNNIFKVTDNLFNYQSKNLKNIYVMLLVIALIYAVSLIK